MRKIQIYSNVEKACIFFDNSTVNPKFLGKVQATEHPTLSDRIIISRNDRTDIINGNVVQRKLFRKLKIDRIQNQNFEDLTSIFSGSADIRGAIVGYLNTQFARSLAADINIKYAGVYDAENNVPDVITDNSNFSNGEWYWVTSSGSFDQDLNGDGNVTLNENDQIRFSITYDTDGVTELSRGWDKVSDVSAKVVDIENASLGQHSVYVDPNYAGTERVGSNMRPFTSLQTAIDAVPTSGSIFIKGTNEISSELTWTDKSIAFYGSADAVIKYPSYDSTNGNIISFEGDNTQEVEFNDITFRNAGGYALLIKKTKACRIRNCEFFNNGWNGQGLHTVLPSSVSGVLGYDSTNTDLQAFYAGTNASNGGAVRLQECRIPLIRECRAEGNLRGFRLQDCGINGGGFVIENQATGNIESGIYLAAGSTYYGCQNITVAVNYSAYNANNGLLCIGGLNNKFSQNEVNGNWNAGACFWGAANSTLRDCGLYDNNRSTYNGIGNVGDAKASIQINEAYNLLGTSITLNTAARFIAEILDTQVHYTGLGSNSSKVGFLITSGVGALSDNPKNIIKVDDVGFIGQDYAIDLSEVDVTNLRLSLGDNSYQSIGQKAVRPPLAGNYSELPFSNHVMQVPSVDVVVDTLKQTIALHEGVGGNVINTYKINELATDMKATTLDIIQKSSDKIQLRDLTFGNIYINGVVAGNSLNSANNSLIGAFNMNLIQYKDFLVSEVGVNGDASSGGSLPAQTDNWFIAYGARSGEQITSAGIVADVADQQPFYNGDFLEKGHEYVWTHDNNGGYYLGVWSGAETNSGVTEVFSSINWSTAFAFDKANGVVSHSSSVGVDVAARYSSGYSISGATLLAMRYGNDNYLYLLDITGGSEVIIGKSNDALIGDTVTIFFGGGNQPNAKFPIMQERTERWTIVADFDDSENGEWVDGIETQTAIKSNMSISPGEKFEWTLPAVGVNRSYGIGYTGAATGNANVVEDFTARWRWDAAELIQFAGDNGWTFNTDNTYYDSILNKWNLTTSQAVQVSYRHTDANVLKMFDETHGELIMTLDASTGGVPMHLYFGANAYASDITQIPVLSKYNLVNIDEATNSMTWYYIESPDGNFEYPLFATEAEANAVDVIEGGGGTSHTHTYQDDLSGTTWYMPNTNGVMTGSNAPSHGIYGNSTNVLWNEIATDDDSNYLPSFTNITYNVQEGSTINVQYKPQGDTNYYSLQNVPSGYADNGFAIIGTAEDITNGYGQAVQHVINVTKANDDFGSVQGTITINVLADLAGNEFTLVDDNGTIKFTQDGGITTLDFNTATFNAGSTYKFYLDGSTLQTNDFVDIVDANGNAVTGNDGLTQSGGSGPGYAGTYLEYVIPSDVAPGKFIRFVDGDTSTQYTDVPLTIAGSTYSEEVTGIDLEGPASNQTSTNLFDTGGYGWVSVDNDLSAGQRIVLSTAFLVDVYDAMPNNTIVNIGAKSTSWTDTSDINSGFQGGVRIALIKMNDGSLQAYSYRATPSAGSSGTVFFSNSAQAASLNFEAFIEITSSGDNVRAGLRTDSTSFSDDASTTPFSDWSDKVQTGDQGYGLTNIDIMVQAIAVSGPYGDMDADEIDWTALTEIAVPVTPTMETSWTKAIDFSGSNEHAVKVSTWNGSNPLLMDSISQVAAGNSNSANTSNVSTARPWATSIVFKADGNSSNQHIWNSGDGAGSNDDNIYLRLSASRELIFGWGRSGAVNECIIHNYIPLTQWIGIYVAHKGTRLSGSNATASNLADAFDIRMCTDGDWTNISQKSTSTNWTNGSTGGRMDRAFVGSLTIGGRGSNRNFHGKVASMVITTLKLGVAMPTDAEIELMITDPKKWEDDYRVGQTVRRSQGANNVSYANSSVFNGHGGTQIWLMGDGTLDSYANGVRNEVYPADQNYGKLQLNSMTSNDIENVTIPGLS